MPRYDAAVIGSGPAGLAAAVNLKIRNKSFLLFGPAGLSGKLAAAPLVENYLGLPGVSGRELAERFQAHIAALGIAVTPGQVSAVYPMGDYYSLATGSGVYEASAVILATGVSSGKPFPGEQELLGRGVGYCATCDAPLYKGKKVAVVGYSEESALEANFLSEVCAEVYFVPQKVPQKAVKALLSERVRLVRDKAVSIRGEKKTEALVLRNGELVVDGVFILRESIAPSSLLPGLALEGPFVKVDCEMRTNLPGCFAAGDCTGKPHQYMRAAGQGQTAALSAAAWLDLQKQNNRKGRKERP